MSKLPGVLALTTIFPDPDLQMEHDNEVKAWLGSEVWTVLDFFSLPEAPTASGSEEKMDWLVNKIRQLKPEMRDCSIDHYWRDVLEESTGLSVIHCPFPVK